jgi:hypothetical protein
MVDAPKLPFNDALEKVEVSYDLGNGTVITMTLLQGDTPAGGRRCGSCSLCCRLVPVATLGKPGNTKCRFSRQHPKGCCSVYATPQQPMACQTWSCRWLIDKAIDTSRPDRAHYVIDVMPDLIKSVREDGEVREAPVVQIWLDPAYPLAHRDPRLRAWVEANARETGMAAIVRVSARDAFLLIPPYLHSDGVWEERGAKIVAKTGMWSEESGVLTRTEEALTEGSVLFPVLDEGRKDFKRAETLYRDDSCLERDCDRCGKRYRGPAVYCCLACALADA